MLEDIIERGTPVPPDGSIFVFCADGFVMSAIANWSAYCTPRPNYPKWLGGAGHGVDYSGPYTHVEVGFPSTRPEPWDEWEAYCEDPESPTDTVYAYVPVGMVRDLVELHGGERAPVASA